MIGRGSRRSIAASFVACLCVLSPRAAPAQKAEPTPALRAEARDRFERGLARFNDGDKSGALAEFKRAYELIENSIVLYNIGLVYAAMGRPVEALAALDRVLAAPGPVAGERLERARRTRDEQAVRVAELTITTSVPALIEVDQIEAGHTPLDAPVRVAAGVRVIGAIANGYVPARREVTVAGGEKAATTFDLVPMQGKLAHLTVGTHLPGADVVIDGQVAGQTPLTQSITLSPGPHVVELRRADYLTARTDLAVGDGASAEVSLDPQPDPAAPASDRGRLALTISEPQAAITIDGQSRGAYAGSLVLPRGVHRLLVERGGFEPAERDVVIQPGSTASVRVPLDPTPETRVAYVNRATSQRTWGIVTTAAGAGVAGAAVAFLVWNSGQKSTASSQYNSAQSNLTNMVGVCALKTAAGDATQCNEALTSAQSSLNSAKSRDAFGYVGVGVGAASVALGVYLLVSDDDPHRYDRSSSSSDVATSLRPVLGGDRRGASVGVAGEF
jgi:hypothetical protein